MNLQFKKRHSYILTVVLFFVMGIAGFMGKNQIQAHAASQGINARYRTQQEIRSYVAANRADLKDNFVFATDPFVELPYNPGRLSEATQQSAVNMLNQIRYIAGISDNVTISSQYCGGIYQLSERAGVP